MELPVTDLVVGTETAQPVLDCVRMFRRDAEVLLVTGSRLFPNGEMHFPDSAVAFRPHKPVALDELTALAAHVDRTGPAPRAEPDAPGPGVPRA